MSATLQKMLRVGAKDEYSYCFHSLMPMRIKHNWRTYSVTVSKNFPPTDQVIKI